MATCTASGGIPLNPLLRHCPVAVFHCPFLNSPLVTQRSDLRPFPPKPGFKVSKFHLGKQLLAKETFTNSANISATFPKIFIPKGKSTVLMHSRRTAKQL